MTTHPYPQKVVEAVAEAMGRSRTGEEWSKFKDYFIEHTHVALSALWEASRVDTVEQLEKLPRDVALIDRHGRVESDYVGTNNIDSGDLPAHIMHWGDQV